MAHRRVVVRLHGSCGFPKTAFYIHQAQWIKDRPVLHIVPHWNWAGSEGKPVKVMATSNADTVELSLNGKSLGEKAMDPKNMLLGRALHAGAVEAVAKKNGREVARQIVETTGEPVALRLTSDRNSLAGDGQDALPVTVEALDQKGRPVPTANASVEFEVSGPGAIIGLGNGDPNCHEPEKGNGHSLFNGLAQVILQGKARSGPAAIAGQSREPRRGQRHPDRPSGSADSRRCRGAPVAYPCRMAHVSAIGRQTRSQPGHSRKRHEQLAVSQTGQDPESRWQMDRLPQRQIPSLQRVRVQGCLQSHRRQGGDMGGRQKASAKTNPKSGAVSVPLPAGPQPHTISILFEVVPNAELGLSREVTGEPAP